MQPAAAYQDFELQDPMAKPHARLTRAEFDRLKADCEELRAEIQLLRQRVQEQAREIHTQFVRMAEVQAVLDEERMANSRPRVPRPLFPTSNDH